MKVEETLGREWDVRWGEVFFSFLFLFHETENFLFSVLLCDIWQIKLDEVWRDPDTYVPIYI